MYIFIKDATLNSETTLPHSGVFVLQHMLAFDMIRAALAPVVHDENSMSLTKNAKHVVTVYF